MACRVLGVSRSGYKDWLGRPASIREQRNTELLKLIRTVHVESRFSYGAPRVHAELTLGLGERVNRKRIERLMREAGIQGNRRVGGLTCHDSILSGNRASTRPGALQPAAGYGS
ncbi:MAG TPA: IS3 family transposase [Spirillospora sp.]|nr:IS3 family transposase [Spirillospora sp.]